MEIGIFYGSQTGNCEALFLQVQKEVGEADVQNISDVSTDDFEKYDLIIFATSTWGNRDLQDDSEMQLGEVENANLK